MAKLGISLSGIRQFGSKASSCPRIAGELTSDSLAYSTEFSLREGSGSIHIAPGEGTAFATCATWGSSAGGIGAPHMPQNRCPEGLPCAHAGQVRANAAGAESGSRASVVAG